MCKLSPLLQPEVVWRRFPGSSSIQEQKVKVCYLSSLGDFVMCCQTKSGSLPPCHFKRPSSERSTCRHSDRFICRVLGSSRPSTFSLCFSNWFWSPSEWLGGGFWTALHQFGRAAAEEMLTFGPFDFNQEVPESLQDVSRLIWGSEVWRKTEVGTECWISPLARRPRNIGSDTFTIMAERKVLGRVSESSYLTFKSTFLLVLLSGQRHSRVDPEPLVWAYYLNVCSSVTKQQKLHMLHIHMHARTQLLELNPVIWR